MTIRILLFALSLFFSASLSASFISTSPGSVPDHLKTENFLRLSATEFEKMSGHKMNFLQRAYFKKLQRQLAKSKVTETDILKHYDQERGKFKLDPLWFLLGVFIGPFAVLFSHTSHNRTRNKQISALIGFGLFIIWFGPAFIF